MFFKLHFQCINDFSFFTVQAASSEEGCNWTQRYSIPCVPRWSHDPLSRPIGQSERHCSLRHCQWQDCGLYQVPNWKPVHGHWWPQFRSSWYHRFSRATCWKFRHCSRQRFFGTHFCHKVSILFVLNCNLIDCSLRLAYIFVIGKGNMHQISLPRGRGLRLTVAEERDKRLAQKQRA